MHMDPELLRLSFPNFMRNCRHVGIDPLREPVPITPAAHYTMGGVATDLDGRASVRGPVRRRRVRAHRRPRRQPAGEQLAAGGGDLRTARGGGSRGRAPPVTGSTLARERASGDAASSAWSTCVALLDSAAGVLRTGAGLNERAARAAVRRRLGDGRRCRRDGLDDLLRGARAARSAWARTRGSTSRRRSRSSASARGRSSPRRRSRPPSATTNATNPTTPQTRRRRYRPARWRPGR